jgi:hypothetical protein
MVRRKRETLLFLIVFLTVVLAFAFSKETSAQVEQTSGSYKVKTPTLDESGPGKSSPSYGLGDSLGQTFQGKASSASYNIYAGFQYYGNALLTLSVSCSAAVSIPAVNPGTPQSANDTCTITTNSTSGYTLYTWQDGDPTRTSPPLETIPAAGLGSYAAPVPWVDGTSQGLGFSLSGPTVEAKWASGANFASFAAAPAAANTYSSPLSGGTTDVNLTYQFDAPITKPSGTYQNRVFYFVTGGIL